MAASGVSLGPATWRLRTSRLSIGSRFGCRGQGCQVGCSRVITRSRPVCATTDISLMAASPRPGPDSDRPSSAPGQLSLDRLCIDTIRTLSMDAVQQANSGHPGTPMALAPVVYTLWQDFLRFDPDDPIWPNRDRFVLSNGHASMLLYSVLHLAGVKAVNARYERLGEPAVTLDDIRRFRQLGGKCPGEPEFHLTSSGEAT